MEIKYELKAPFPWFGGKRTVAHEVWKRFGDVKNYVEPFAGSLAVLLNRPYKPGIETVNDIDCYLSNFWRSLKNEPDAVAMWADYPVNEADLHARHLWLISRSLFRERMKSDPDYYDVKIAGWWVWGICQWIGSGWCNSRCYTTEQQLSHLIEGGVTFRKPKQQVPHLGNAGMGIHRPSQQLPHLGDAGRGIHRPSQQLPHLGDAGRGDIYDYLNLLSDRLRSVRVACGNWDRVLGDSSTFRHGITGIFLDPPYSHDERDPGVYANDNDIAKDVFEWAVENGGNKKLRIAFCGYDGEHEFPNDWIEIKWKAIGGYGSQGDGSGRENAIRERIWFSPYCINDSFDLPLFSN